MSIQSCYRIFYLCTVVLYGSCQPDDRSNLHKQDCEYIVKKWDKSTTPFTTKGLTPLKKPWWKKKIKIKRIEVPRWLCIAGAGVVAIGGITAGVLLYYLNTPEDLSSPETAPPTTAVVPYAEESALRTDSGYAYPLATGSLALGATWLATCTGLKGLLHGSREVRKKECNSLAKEAFSESLKLLKTVDTTAYDTTITPIDEWIAEKADVEVLLDVFIDSLFEAFRLCFPHIDKKSDFYKKQYPNYLAEISSLMVSYKNGKLPLRKKKRLYDFRYINLKGCIDNSNNVPNSQEAAVILYLANKVDQYVKGYTKSRASLPMPSTGNEVKKVAH